MATTTNAVVPRTGPPAKIEPGSLEAVLVGGDLSKLTPDQRVQYYHRVCESLNLNPYTKPFAYITLSGKLTLYALRDCADQLRRNNKISIEITSRNVVDGILVVTAKATTPDGRTDESIGALPVANLKGEMLSNAWMKAETKAKRRVTLSICGLGWTDETEIESIRGAAPAINAEVIDALEHKPEPPPGGVEDVRRLVEQAGVDYEEWRKPLGLPAMQQLTEAEAARVCDLLKVRIATKGGKK